MEACERHDIRRCTICIGIFSDERHQATEATGTKPQPAPIGAGVIEHNAVKRPAITFREHKADGDTWARLNATAGQNQNRLHRDRVKQGHNSLAAAINAAKAERLGVTL